MAALQGAATGRLGRLRAEIDRRRRPLLLGLAAIVLALGALQAITMRGADEPRPAAPTSQVAPSRGDAATVQRDAPDVSKDAVKESAEAKPAPADPTTTQALPSPVPAEARPNAKSAVPQVSGMNTLQAELGNLPPALAKVKLAALDGDGAAIWDLATREADGRGMPRDLSIAAKLYEKLASAGYAPAQYKLAGHYEKGSGVVRDLDKAKLWYGRAAEQGHARSMHNLAVLYAENPAANGKPDFASAASWFRQGAEFGVRDSQYNLGVLYARGLGLTQDLIQSYAWFSAAASQGDDDAGKKRDDVANKLSPADLASAQEPRGELQAAKDRRGGQRAARAEAAGQRADVPARRADARRRSVHGPAASELMPVRARGSAAAPTLTATPRCGNAAAGRRRTGGRIARVANPCRCPEDGWRTGTPVPLGAIVLGVRRAHPVPGLRGPGGVGHRRRPGAASACRPAPSCRPTAR